MKVDVCFKISTDVEGHNAVRHYCTLEVDKSATLRSIERKVELLRHEVKNNVCIKIEDMTITLR